MPKKRTNIQRTIKRKRTGKLTKWNSIEDIPMDAEDEFHAAKDKILLERDAYGGYSDDGDEDEVFALNGMQDGSESEVEQDDPLDQEYYETGEDEQAPSTKKTKKDKKSKKVNGKSITRIEETGEEEDDAEEGWGQGKAAYYSSNADQLDSDDEEGHELEEQEAIRLQNKNRQELQNEDFGLNDELEFEKRQEADDILDPLPTAIPALSTDKQSLLRHLEKTNPESLALAKDWEDVAHQLHRTRLKINKLEEEKTEPLGLGMIHLHYQTLLSYSTVLAFYLYMRASAKYAQRPALLQSHPIMQRLLTLKQSLQLFEDLDFAATEIGDEEDDSDYGMDDFLDGEKVWSLREAGVLEPNELDDLLQDAETHVLPETKDKRPRKKRKVVIEDKMEPRNNPIFDLVEPQFVSSNSSLLHRQKNSVSEDLLDNYGDVMSLADVDAADKSARRKNLRFHTSRIESASSRRKGARNQMAGGDDDIPYRERKKDRDVRLVKEAVKRAENERGGDLTLGDDEDEEEKYSVGDKRTRLDEADDSPDEYYELVKKKSKEGKLRKKAEYDEAHSLSRVPIEEESSGPRSLTRAILKNKGLTPQRAKAVRNPRVKKRQKFEKAKRKVSSQKALYKGGLSETKGRYEGEKSGISKVVKSVRLG